MPFTATPDDSEAHGRELFERALAGEFGEIAEYVEPGPVAQEQLIESFSAGIQKRLDNFAKTRRYTNGDSLSKYATLTDAEIAGLPTEEDRTIVTRYRTECRYLLLKIAQTWAVGEQIMAAVQAGQRRMPSSIADIEADLPALVWPS